MSQDHPLLFAPLRVDGLLLPNRVVAAPMFQLRPITGPEGIGWYRRLAAGGAGTVVVEGTAVDRLGNELTADALGPLARAIREQGATAAMQLAPPDGLSLAQPDDLDAPAIRGMIGHYVQAARTCRQAGFQAVQIHGGHGFLLNQFFMPDKNTRTDGYGGTLENRCRLAVEIAAAVRAAVGDDLLLMYRLSPTGDYYTLEESLTLAERLVAAGVRVLDISPAMANRPADLAAPFKARLSVPVVAVGLMEDPNHAAAALAEGRCDLVALGRQLIADAQWPSKVRQGQLDAILPCRKCNMGCFGSLHQHKPVICAQWKNDEVAPFIRAS